MTRVSWIAWCAGLGLSVLLAGTARAQTPAAAAPGPTLAEARKMLAAAQAAATKMNQNLSCAVMDARGDIVAIERMDKARFFTVDIARGKALASATFGQPSGSLAALANSPLFPGINTAAVP